MPTVFLISNHFKLFHLGSFLLSFLKRRISHLTLSVQSVYSVNKAVQRNKKLGGFFSFIILSSEISFSTSNNMVNSQYPVSCSSAFVLVFLGLCVARDPNKVFYCRPCRYLYTESLFKQEALSNFIKVFLLARLSVIFYRRPTKPRMTENVIPSCSLAVLLLSFSLS